MIAYIGIGTNLGDRLANIKRAIEYFKAEEEINAIVLSNLYETEPVGYRDQPEFINGVIELKTSFSLQNLFIFLKNVEKKMGRIKTFKYGPRIIDLDILFYDDVIYSDLDIIVPHPHLKNRAFVLYPLAELCENYIHPLYFKSIANLKNDLINEQRMKKLEIQDFPGIFK